MGREENIEWLLSGTNCEIGQRPYYIHNKLIISPYYSLRTTLGPESRLICADNGAIIPFTVGNTEIFPPTIALQIKRKGESVSWSSSFVMRKGSGQDRYNLLIKDIPDQAKYFNREVEFEFLTGGGAQLLMLVFLFLH